MVADPKASALACSLLVESSPGIPGLPTERSSSSGLHVPLVTPRTSRTGCNIARLASSLLFAGLFLAGTSYLLHGSGQRACFVNNCKAAMTLNDLPYSALVQHLLHSNYRRIESMISRHGG
jgi:hypothetical protein